MNIACVKLDPLRDTPGPADDGGRCIFAALCKQKFVLPPFLASAITVK